MNNTSIDPVIAICQGCGKKFDGGWIDVEYRHPETQKIIEFRRAVACLECCDRMDADMWVSRGCWDGLNPVVPYEQLPLCEA